MRSFVMLLAFMAATILVHSGLQGGAVEAGEAAKASSADNAVSAKALEGSWTWATTSGSEMYTFGPDGTFSYLLVLAVNSSTFYYRDMREYREKSNPYATSLFKKGKYKIDGPAIRFFEVYMGGSSASSGSGDSAMDKLARQKIEYHPAENFELKFEMWPAGVLRLKGAGDTLFGRHGEPPHPGAPLPKHRIPPEPWPAESVGPDLPEYKHGRIMSVAESESRIEIRIAETDKTQFAKYAKQLKDKGWTYMEDSFSPRARFVNKTARFSWDGKGPLTLSLTTEPLGVWPKGIPDEVFPPAGASLIGEIKVEKEKDGLIQRFSFEVDKTDKAGVERYFAALAGKGWEREEDAYSPAAGRRFRWNGDRWKARIAHRDQEGAFASFRVECENLKRAVWPARELPPDLPQPANSWLDEDPRIDKAEGNRKTIRVVFHGMGESEAEKYIKLLEAKGWERPEDSPEALSVAKRLTWNRVRHKADVEWGSDHGRISSLRIVLTNLSDAVWPAKKLPPDVVPPKDCWLDEKPELNADGRDKTILKFVCHGMKEEDESAYHELLERNGWERNEEAYGEAVMEKRFRWEGKRCRASLERYDHSERLLTYRVAITRLDAAVWPAAKLPPDIIPPKDAWLDEEVDTDDISAKGGRFRFVCYGLGDAGEEEYYALLQSKGWERLEDYTGDVTMEKRFRNGKSRYKAAISNYSREGKLNVFRVEYENLDAAVWPAAKLPPDIVPPQNCWLDQEVDLDVYEEAGGTVRFTCHGMGEKERAAYFRLLESKGWKKPDIQSDQEREKTITWKGRKYRGSISLSSQENSLSAFRASYEPGE